VVLLASVLTIAAVSVPGASGARRTAVKPKVTKTCVKRKHVKRNVHKRRARRGLYRSPDRCRASPVPSRVRLRRPAPLTGETTEGGFVMPTPPEFEPEGDDEEAEPDVGIGPLIRAPTESSDPSPGGEEAPAEPEARAAATGDVKVIRNVDLKAPEQPSSTNLIARHGYEQSVATNGKGLVLFTGNTFAAASTDGGRTFRDLNLTATDGTAVFPSAAGGVCCDQRVVYIPSVDRFVWIVQYWNGAMGAKDEARPNAMRLATATSAEFLGSGGRRWTQYVFTPSDFGLTNRRDRGALIDHPSLVYTSGHLYMTFLSINGAREFGTQIVRIPLRELGGSIHYPNYRNVGGSEIIPAQNQPGGSTYQYFAHFITNTRLEVIEANDSRPSVLQLEVDVPTVGNRFYRSVTPNGDDWMLRTAKKAALDVFSGARAGRKVWFAWVAGREAIYKLSNGKIGRVKVHDQPAIEAIAMDFVTFRRTDYETIEYDRLAANSPEIRANAAGEVGISYRLGGPSLIPSHAVGFLRDDYAAAIIASGTGDEGAVPGGAASHDYSGLAVDPAQPKCFVAAGAAVKAPAGMFQPADYVDPHYAVFGRARAACRNPMPFVPGDPGPVFPKPDLVVSDVTSTTAQVRNVGTAAAGRFDIVVRGPGLLESRFTIADGLRAGGATTVGFACQNGLRVAIADANGEVAESDEANNRRGFPSECEGRG
jgi:CARDB protein